MKPIRYAFFFEFEAKKVIRYSWIRSGCVVFKNFVIDKKIGVGAFGEIYKAHNQSEEN